MFKSINSLNCICEISNEDRYLQLAQDYLVSIQEGALHWFLGHFRRETLNHFFCFSLETWTLSLARPSTTTTPSGRTNRRQTSCYDSRVN